jgi:hypothetical protein
MPEQEPAQAQGLTVVVRLPGRLGEDFAATASRRQHSLTRAMVDAARAYVRGHVPRGQRPSESYDLGYKHGYADGWAHATEGREP